MSNLLSLMKLLAKDAALCAEYTLQPRRVCKQHGLSAEEIDVLLRHDYARIMELTGLKQGQFSTNHTIRAYDDMG